MSEKKQLSDALKRHAANGWVAAALSAIEDEHVVFAGNANAGASNTAMDLLRIYRIRQSHCRARQIEACGLTQLIESLAACRESDVIEVQPFLGPGRSITAFWNTAGNLIGCITLLGRDPESGRQSLDIANGN